MIRKIVIEIPEDEKFDWNVAMDLWRTFMPNCKNGFNNTTPISYVWYDISPLVNTTPLSGALLDKCNFKEMKKEIECIERKIYDLKQKLSTLTGKL